MNFEKLPKDTNADQIITEVIEDLDRGLYDTEDHQEVVAKLLTARITTLPESPERKQIDELLGDIETRYGKI